MGGEHSFLDYTFSHQNLSSAPKPLTGTVRTCFATWIRSSSRRLQADRRNWKSQQLSKMQDLKSRQPHLTRTWCAGRHGAEIYIQVAKQVRTVPVRGFGAEERFDAEECDLENYASPSPPQFFGKSHMLEKEFKTQATNLRE